MADSKQMILETLEKAKSNLEQIGRIKNKVRTLSDSKSDISVDIKKEDYDTSQASVVRYRINTESEALTKKRGNINIFINLFVYIALAVVAIVMFSKVSDKVISAVALSQGDDTFARVAIVVMCIGIFAGAILVLLNALSSSNRYPPTVFKVLSIIGCGFGGMFLLVLLTTVAGGGDTYGMGGFFGAIGVLGIGVVFSIVKGIIDRGTGSRVHRMVRHAHYDELEKAEKADESEEKRYQKDVESAKQKKAKEIDAEIESLEKQKEALWAEIEALSIMPRKDIEKDFYVVWELIIIIRDEKADTLKGAIEIYEERQKEKERRARIEEEERKRKEKERKAAEEKRRAELAAKEAEIKRNSPGRVVVFTTEDGKGKNAEVYIDGGYYGAISYAIGFCSYQLAPGPHTVSVVIHSQGYNFQSAPQSFYLEGGTEVTLHFMLLGYNNIYCLVK